MHDLIIIGSGPAGLSAAVYGRRAGFSTLVIEKNPMSGGQVLNTYEVDNYLGLPGINGFDMGMKFREHAEKMQAEFIEADVLGVEDMGDYKLVKTTDGDYEAKAVIIASGASHSHLGVPGEEELSGMGVSYCATCDGAFFRGKTVAVIGGGDVAVEDAIFLARACEKVYLIHRRDSCGRRSPFRIPCLPFLMLRCAGTALWKASMERDVLIQLPWFIKMEEPKVNLRYRVFS